MYKQAVASFWTVEEVDLSQDYRDWDRLNGEALMCGQGVRGEGGEDDQPSTTTPTRPGLLTHLHTNHTQ
jgi:hypothetical protein